jgi:5-(carboxyamino)imidazole ribonucleotide synthase
VDVVTYEFENVPEASIQFLAEHVAVFPSAAPLAIARDRLEEKTLFKQLGIATPAFAVVDTLADLERALQTIGLPAVLKTRTLGYDGKGQYVLQQSDDVAIAWKHLGSVPRGVPLILEGFVNFQREISIIGVRSRNGETAFYPLAENVHRDGILRLSRSRPNDPVTAQARQYLERLLDRLDYVGVLALELFQVGDSLLANEMAPRVHNSGHWTIEGVVTSQFENHLRAVLGLPLGSTAATGFAAMVNFIGELPEAADVLMLPGAHLHIYGKEPRPGRKIGHATVCAASERELAPGLEKLLQLVEPDAAALTAARR